MHRLSLVAIVKMIEIEFSEPKVMKCECCGNETTTLTRFVYKDGYAHAIYNLRYTMEHSDKFVFGVISIGEWGEDVIEPERIAFPFEIRKDGEQYQIGMVDRENSPWQNVAFLGKILNRKESLEHPWITEVFHITDHITWEDKEIL